MCGEDERSRALFAENAYTVFLDQYLLFRSPLSESEGQTGHVTTSSTRDHGAAALVKGFAILVQI